MEFFNTIEAATEYINALEKGTGNMFCIPLSLFPQLFNDMPELFSEKFAENFRENPAEVFSSMLSDTINSDYEISGVSSVALVGTISHRCGFDGDSHSLELSAVNWAVKIGEQYFRPYMAQSRRSGLALYGAAENVLGRDFDHPNYFSKPSARSLKAWAEFATAKDATNRADIAKVHAERAAVLDMVKASGLEWRETSGGIRMEGGPLTVEIEFGRSGCHYRAFINNSVTGFGSSIFDYVITTFGAQAAAPSCTTPVEVTEAPEVSSVEVIGGEAAAPTVEAPTEQKPEQSRIAFHAFNRLSTVQADGVEVWSTDAVAVMKKAMAADSPLITDICGRALAGEVRMSRKQRWCVAYAYARAI